MGAHGVEQRDRVAARGGRREKEERRGKRKREEGETSMRFAAAVGHARAAAFGRSATSTQIEGKGKRIGQRLVLVSGRRIAGKIFGESGSRTEMI